VLVSVTLLRRDGVRLRQTELRPAAVGDLRVSDAGCTSLKRPILVAYLWEQRSSLDRPIGRPTFEPTLVHIGVDGFSLAGMELQAVDGRLREVGQVWRCTPV
jgi:hypothetical protein